MALIPYKVVIEASAEKDLDDVFQYICEDLYAPDAANRLFLKFKESIFSLSTLPFRHRLVKEEPFRMMGIRSIPIENYNVFYSVEEKERTVKVLRILYYRREWHAIIE